MLHRIFVVLLPSRYDSKGAPGILLVSVSKKIRKRKRGRGDIFFAIKIPAREFSIVDGAAEESERSLTELFEHRTNPNIDYFS